MSLSVPSFGRLESPPRPPLSVLKDQIDLVDVQKEKWYWHLNFCEHSKNRDWMAVSDGNGTGRCASCTLYVKVQHLRLRINASLQCFRSRGIRRSILDGFEA